MASKFIEEIRRYMRMRGYRLKTDQSLLEPIKLNLSSDIHNSITQYLTRHYANQ